MAAGLLFFMTTFQRVDPKICLRLAERHAKIKGRYGPVKQFIAESAVRYYRSECTIWRWVKAGQQIKKILIF